MPPHFEDLRQAAFNAEKDLNSYQAKQGLGKKSDSSTSCRVLSLHTILTT